MNPIVIRFGRLGDMLLLAPLLHRLHLAYGEPCVLFGTGPWSEPLYAHHPDVARVLQVNARHRPFALSPPRWRMLHALRVLRDAPVHVCEVEPRPLARIRRLLAMAHVDPSRCVFVADAPPLPDEHWIDRLLRTGARPPAAFTGAWRASAVSGTCAAPRLCLSDADRRDRDGWLRAFGWTGQPLWLVQPANKRSMRWNGPRDPADDDKAWPSASWAEVLRALHHRDPDARLLLCGSPREAPLLEGIARIAGLERVAVAARDLPLRRLMALCEIARGMLSVDTGPAHVAAAMGCPLVVLFGAQSPRVWRPRSPSGSAVIVLGGPPQRTRIMQITPEEVIAAAQALPARAPSLDEAR